MPQCGGADRKHQGYKCGKRTELNLDIAALYRQLVKTYIKYRNRMLSRYRSTAKILSTCRPIKHPILFHLFLSTGLILKNFSRSWNFFFHFPKLSPTHISPGLWLLTESSLLLCKISRVMFPLSYYGYQKLVNKTTNLFIMFNKIPDLEKKIQLF